mgnify:CR=1 FL=1
MACTSGVVRLRLVGQNAVDACGQRCRHRVRIGALDLHAFDQRAGVRIGGGGLAATNHRQAARERFLQHQGQSLANRGQNEHITRLIERRERRALQIAQHMARWSAAIYLDRSAPSPPARTSDRGGGAPAAR